MRIGIPVINRGDLLEALFHSIDHPVEEIIIVVNRWGAVESSVAQALSRIVKTKSRFGRLSIHEMNGNLGASGSYNYILKEAGPALIASSDVAFTKGSIEAALRFIRSEPLAPMHFLHARCAFHVSAMFLVNIGYFDENFWPWGWDDIDISYRSQKILRTTGMNLPKTCPQIRHDHPSQSLRGWTADDRKIGDWMRRASAHNRAYGCRKWGITRGDHFMLNARNRWSIDPDVLFAIPFEGRRGAKTANDWTLDLPERMRRISDLEARTGIVTKPCYCFDSQFGKYPKAGEQLTPADRDRQ